MSLYRTYRPKTFADVVGQDAVVSTLENAVAQGKIGHAYLFAGSRGTGKTSVARILAKEMLTHGMKEKKIVEQIRTSVDDGSLVDLTEIDGASNRGIDDIRGLVEKIQFSPVAATAKVFIIDEVHMLTKEAFNALLKTLEEPPAYAYFILATTELQKIPATIQSRCQRFAFRQVSEDDIVRRLQFIADQERIPADRVALRAIASHAEGAVRDAVALLDQLRSLPKITADDVKERTGQSGQEYTEGLLNAIDTGDRKTILDLVRGMESAGLSLESVTRTLLGEVRLRMHKAIDSGEPIAGTSRALSTLLAALRDMRIAPVPGLVLEAALLSLCDEPAEASAESKTRMFAKRETPGAPAKTPIVEKPAPKKVESPPQPQREQEPAKTDATVEAPNLTMATLRESWPSVVRDLSPASLKMSLKNGHVHALKGDKIVLGFASAFHRDKVAKTDAARIVEQTLEKIFKRQLRIECILEQEHKAAGTDKEMVNLAEAAAEVF